MVDMSTYRHFVHVVVVVQTLVVSLNHGKRKLLFLVEFPTVLWLLQLWRLKHYFRFIKLLRQLIGFFSFNFVLVLWDFLSIFVFLLLFDFAFVVSDLSVLSSTFFSLFHFVYLALHDIIICLCLVPVLWRREAKVLRRVNLALLINKRLQLCDSLFFFFIYLGLVFNRSFIVFLFCSFIYWSQLFGDRLEWFGCNRLHQFR